MFFMRRSGFDQSAVNYVTLKSRDTLSCPIDYENPMKVLLGHGVGIMFSCDVCGPWFFMRRSGLVYPSVENSIDLYRES